MDRMKKEAFYEGRSREEVVELFYDMFYGNLAGRIDSAENGLGRVWLIRGLEKFGADRGRELAADFERSGLAKNLPNLLAHFDFVIRGERSLQLTDTGCCFTVKSSERLRSMAFYGSWELVRVYLSSVFPVLADAFDGGFRLDQVHLMPEQNQAVFTFSGNVEGEVQSLKDGLLRNKEYAAKIKDLYDTMYGFIAYTSMKEGKSCGEALVREGIRDFGNCRGRRLRKMHLAAGLELNLFNLMDYYDIPPVEGYAEEKEVFTPYIDICNVDTCNHYERWKEKDLLLQGVIYCEEVHAAFWTAYNENIVVRQPEILTKGDGRCRFETVIVRDENAQ